MLTILQSIHVTHDPVFLKFERSFQVIYQTQDTVFHHISNTEKRVENTTRSGVFLTNFEVFDIGMKHCDECLISKHVTVHDFLRSLAFGF